MTSPVSAIKAIEKAIEHATPGVWDIWEERTPTKADAIAEMAYQVENTEPFSGAVFLLNADGKCPAATGCGQTSAANAAYIAACNPVAMREVLALARQAEALQRENAELREALRPFADVADLVDSETEGVADSDEFQMHFHDYLMASWKLSIFRRARALLGGENAGN